MEEHNTRLRAVLKCFAEAGLRLKKEKSIFAAAQVEFWGFRVDKDGIKPTSEKVEADVTLRRRCRLSLSLCSLCHILCDPVSKI